MTSKSLSWLIITGLDLLIVYEHVRSFVLMSITLNLFTLHHICHLVAHSSSMEGSCDDRVHFPFLYACLLYQDGVLVGAGSEEPLCPFDLSNSLCFSLNIQMSFIVKRNLAHPGKQERKYIAVSHPSMGTTWQSPGMQDQKHTWSCPKTFWLWLVFTIWKEWDWLVLFSDLGSRMERVNLT